MILMASLRHQVLQMDRRTHGTRGGVHLLPSRTIDSMEFEGYKLFTPGDDIRLIDWYKTRGRHDFQHIQVKCFEAQEKKVVDIFLDVSESMLYSIGKDEAKFALMQKLVFLLAYTFLVNYDIVRLVGFPGHPAKGLDSTHWISKNLVMSEPLSGRDSYSRIQEFMNHSNLDAHVMAYFSKTIEEYITIRPPHRRDLAIVISDFLSERDEYEPGLEQLASMWNKVLAIQVLSDREIELPRDLDYIKYESVEMITETKNINVADKATRTQFESNSAGLRKQFAQACDSHFINHTLAKTSFDLQEQMFESFIPAWSAQSWSIILFIPEFYTLLFPLILTIAFLGSTAAIIYLHRMKSDRQYKVQISSHLLVKKNHRKKTTDLQ